MSEPRNDRCAFCDEECSAHINSKCLFQPTTFEPWARQVQTELLAGSAVAFHPFCWWCDYQSSFIGDRGKFSAAIEVGDGRARYECQWCLRPNHFRWRW